MSEKKGDLSKKMTFKITSDLPSVEMAVQNIARKGLFLDMAFSFKCALFSFQGHYLCGSRMLLSL
jgi:hypothetical protein